MIVEEAAEVLEAHIITSLSASCKHLILIGKLIECDGSILNLLNVTFLVSDYFD